jgi:GDP-L-fucose synthase
LGSQLCISGTNIINEQTYIRNSFKPSSNEVNLFNYNELKTYIERNNITKIIHCAAKVGGIKANHTKLYDFFSDNLQMNLNILKACKEYRLQNSIFILSTCILPVNVKLPYTENQLHEGEPHFTNYGYAYSKRMLEVGARSLWDQYNIKTTCLIPCNLFGPKDNYNLDDGHVIPSLIHKCYLAKKFNKDFIIWGSGNPEREFLYADDLALVIEKMIKEEKNYPHKIIISSGESYKIKDIVELIAKKMNFNGNIIFDKTYPDGIIKKPTDITLFKETFPDFKIRSIEEGLNNTINYFINNYPNIRV